MNYVLIILAMLVTNSADGGAAMTVATERFATLTACNAAADAVRGEGAVVSVSNSRWVNGQYRVTARCVRDQ